VNLRSESTHRRVQSALMFLKDSSKLNHRQGGRMDGLLSVAIGDPALAYPPLSLAFKVFNLGGLLVAVVRAPVVSSTGYSLRLSPLGLCTGSETQ
jgi:hypothetical protein